MLDDLCLNASKSNEDILEAVDGIEMQFQDSEIIKSDINQLADDSKIALEYSSENIELTKELISKLKY